MVGIKSLRNIALRTLQIFPMLFAYTDPTNRIQPNEFNEIRSEMFAGDAPKYDKEKYWLTTSAAEVISLADEEFAHGNYLEVYELLNRARYRNNAHVQWRLARTLYKLSKEKLFTPQTQREMIREAYDLLTTSRSGEPNSQVFKWLAIIVDANKSYEGFSSRLRAFPYIRQLLIQATQLNPDDSMAYYILGKLSFEISHLNVLQRFVARIFFGPVPEASYSEAYDYLFRSFEIRKDNYFIPTIYMLGESCYHMNQFYRAEYYLEQAAHLQPRSAIEVAYVEKAKQLLENLQSYDLLKDTMLFEFPEDNS